MCWLHGAGHVAPASLAKRSGTQLSAGPTRPCGLGPQLPHGPPGLRHGALQYVPRRARAASDRSRPVRITWLAQQRKSKKPPHGGLSHCENGGQGRNRTADTGIFNPLLYQLSYLAGTSEEVALWAKAGIKPAPGPAVKPLAPSRPRGRGDREPTPAPTGPGSGRRSLPAWWRRPGRRTSPSLPPGTCAPSVPPGSAGTR